MQRNEENPLAQRVVVLRAEELAILLDAVNIWEFKEFIPVESRRIPTVERGTMSLATLTELVALNKHHDCPAKGGIPKPTEVLKLKCRKTGLTQETLPKH